VSIDMDIGIYKQFTGRVQLTSIDSNMRLPFAENINAFKQWKDELPILDTYACTRLLADASKALLAPQINPNIKFELANEAQTCLNGLLSSCKDKLKGANLPLRKQQIDLCNELLKATSFFSDIYIQLIGPTDSHKTNTAQQNDQKQVPPPIPTDALIFKAMELMAKKQFLMSLIYQTPEASLWNTVNALYSLAESLNIQQKVQVALDKEGTSSIEAEFKKIHFFNLAGVNRFRRGDIKQIQQILALQANQIAISSTPETASTFCIDLASCSAVSYILPSTKSNDTTRYLNTEQLIKFMLSDELVAHEQHGAVSLISNEPRLRKKVIHQLIPNWSSQPSRQSNRHAQNESVLIYPGFDSIIKALIQIATPAINEKSTEPDKKPTSFNVSDLSLIPMDDNQHHSHVIRNDSVINTVLKKTAEESVSSRNIWTKRHQHKFGEKGERMNANVNDTSLQGLHFKVSADNKPLLKVTDLIGIQTKTETLQLAIIRRLNKLVDGEVSVGVEMMSPHLKIASLRTLEKGADIKPVIFLQGIPSINQADAIICPLMIENKNFEVLLKVNKQTTIFSIDQTVETNRVFSHYTVLKKTEVD